jgi:hypothetical protein
MLANNEITPDETGQSESTGHLRHTLSGWRQFARVAYRDPEHVAERLAFTARRASASPRWSGHSGSASSVPAFPGR